MKLIIGLGNPGAQYDGTRHNIGFELLDALARAHAIPLTQKRAKAVVGTGIVAGEKVLLAKPQTFMNLSGETVATLVREADGATVADILIVVDEIHLPPGKIRLRAQGSSGGHNGLKSIASRLATQEFSRLRIGVGEPPPDLQIDWVLGRYNKTDRALMDEALIVAMGAAEVWLREGIEAAMNRFNSDAASAPPIKSS